MSVRMCRHACVRVVFTDGEHELLQGALGDSWLLGAVGCVATRRDLLDVIFASTRNKLKGIYTLRFYKRGQVCTTRAMMRKRKSPMQERERERALFKREKENEPIQEGERERALCKSLDIFKRDLLKNQNRKTFFFWFLAC